MVQKRADKMAVYKDGDKWRVVFRFTNWKGERTQTQKRGFATKREAQMWEREELLKQGSKLDMTFASFFEIYEEDKKKRVKENTWESKSHVYAPRYFRISDSERLGRLKPKTLSHGRMSCWSTRTIRGKNIPRRI